MLNILRPLSLIVCLFSFIMLPPCLLSFYFQDGYGLPFLLSFLLLWIIGGGIYCLVGCFHRDLNHRDGILLMVLIWLCLSVFSALPLLPLYQLGIPVVDILFEATSAFIWIYF